METGRGRRRAFRSHGSASVGDVARLGPPPWFRSAHLGLLVVRQTGQLRLDRSGALLCADPSLEMECLVCVGFIDGDRVSRPEGHAAVAAVPGEKEDPLPVRALEVKLDIELFE